MKRTKKTLKLRGSRTYGKGFQVKTGKGGRGGTGNAGSFSHKYISTVLKQKKAIKNKKIINLRDLNERIKTLVKKNYITKVQNKEGKNYYTTKKFAQKYKKITGIGELSFKLNINSRVKVSKSAKAKLI